MTDFPLPERPLVVSEWLLAQIQADTDPRLDAARRQIAAGEIVAIARPLEEHITAGGIPWRVSAPRRGDL